ncbi:MAG TPA: zinc-ribbon domain-containing protein, partial [Xanthobacteraceae bacterium]|nr:zinc-ribbon domain-containing protein [Xanthobacteraceae bacterium]
MLLSCPSCETSFRVKPEALGPSGRTVRCARCQTSWFALPEGAELEPAIAAPAMEAGSAAMPDAAASDLVSWHEEPAEGEAPPLAPDGGEAAIAAPRAEMREDGAEAESMPARKPPPARPPLRKNSRKRLGVAAFAAAAAFVVMMIAARANVVRAVPDLAGVYAAVGLPVNLRGLEFRDVRTTSEIQDGITVLVIEGEVVN